MAAWRGSDARACRAPATSHSQWKSTAAPPRSAGRGCAHTPLRALPAAAAAAGRARRGVCAQPRPADRGGAAVDFHCEWLVAGARHARASEPRQAAIAGVADEAPGHRAGEGLARPMLLLPLAGEGWDEGVSRENPP